MTGEGLYGTVRAHAPAHDIVHRSLRYHQIVKEFKVPQRFAHYAPGRLPGILKLFYNQLIERGL